MTFRKTALWILAAGLLIALILAYPAYKEIRLWRANQMAQQAEEMLTSPETLSRAWELAHAANALNPDDAEIARVLAKVYSASDPSAAYDFWQHVVELSSGNPDDQLELARAYLNAKKWEEFDAEILKQRKAELHPRELDYLETLAAMLQGKFTDAFRMATELVAQEDTPEAADALFFQMTQRSADAATRRAGIDNLWKIASGQD
ncbi:MAG: hypothetical protein HRT56_08710, partial [Coraliomargarita sp.]|nr:hypothetical protein [Coraliomargarita sp.]